MKTLQTYIYQIKKITTNKTFITKHKTKPTYFTRNTAKLTFDKLITYQLSLPKQSAQISLNKIIKQNKWKFTMNKQSLFDAREKLNHTAFIDLNNNHFLKDYAYNNKNNNTKTFHNHRVIAVDGSIFDVPYGAKEFGTLKTPGEPSPKARAIAFVDILNEYILRAQLQPCNIGEANITKQMLNEYWQTSQNNNSNISDLFLFDRGFFSRALAQSIYDHNAYFLFRVHSHSLREVQVANKPDQVVVRREKGKPDLVLRVINYVLPTGEVEKLVTNIFDVSFSVEVFGELYGLRWGVETCFRSLKSRLQIENFSSAKRELILQDFFASVFVYNLMVASIAEATLRVAVKQCKYVYRVNKNVAIGEVRDLLIGSFCEDDLVRRGVLFDCAMDVLRRNVVPVRPGRSYVRMVKYGSTKFHINNKSGL